MKLKTKILISIAIIAPLLSIVITLPIVLIDKKEEIILPKNNNNTIVNLNKANSLTSIEKNNLISFVEKQRYKENENYFFIRRGKSNFSDLNLLDNYLTSAKKLLSKEEYNNFLDKLIINFDSIVSYYQISYFLNAYLMKNVQQIDQKEIINFLDRFYHKESGLFVENNKKDSPKINDDIILINLLIWEAFFENGYEIPQKYNIFNPIQDYLLKNLDSIFRDENDFAFFISKINKLKKWIY